MNQITDEDILAMRRVPAQTAARYLGMSDNVLYEGLKNGDFPFGTATKGSKGRWEFDIRPQALVNYNRSGRIDMTALANEITKRLLANESTQKLLEILNANIQEAI